MQRSARAPQRGLSSQPAGPSSSCGCLSASVIVGLVFGLGTFVVGEARAGYGWSERSSPGSSTNARHHKLSLAESCNGCQAGADATTVITEMQERQPMSQIAASSRHVRAPLRRQAGPDKPSAVTPSVGTTSWCKGTNIVGAGRQVLRRMDPRMRDGKPGDPPGTRRAGPRRIGLAEDGKKRCSEPARCTHAQTHGCSRFSFGRAPALDALEARGTVPSPALGDPRRRPHLWRRPSARR